MKKTLKDRILELLKARPGLTDCQITDVLLGPEVGQQAVNQAARQLAQAGRIVRTLVAGVLRNRGGALGRGVKFGHDRGIDVAARRDGVRRIIEPKGAGKHDQMRVNFFLCALGELVRRMDDPDALHSLAMPDLAPYRRHWKRLPTLAKQRLRLSALFVTASGYAEEDRT